MADNKLKISADTSEVKKSILDLGKQLKDIKGSKVAIFSNDDKKFLRSELKKEMTLIKAKLQENRKEIEKLVSAQQDLTDGSKEELENRMKILDAYKTQAKLGRQMGDLSKAKKEGGGGLMSDLAGNGAGMAGKILGAIGLGSLAVAAVGVAKTIQATSQVAQTASSRVRLKGLGVGEDSFGSANDLARVGLTEQDMIERRTQATSVLGRQGTDSATEMRKAGFERAYGLEGGTMTNVAGALRGQAGGAAATSTQMKLQATIMAAGLEDAIGPYLENATKLLSEINENGNQNTGEMLSYLAQLSKDGQRTPEQIGKMMQSMNNSVKGAKGEASAFIQTAFARAGIGGGTIGGTKFAMESGGIMGLNKDELAKRGYNPQLLNNMQKSGMFSGMGQRSNALLDQFKRSGGLRAGQNISGITNTNQMIGMGNLANNVFGTKGNQGFEILQMMEKVQNKQMTQKSFDDKVKKMQEETPETKRLDDINNSLMGQTDILTNIQETLETGLGKQGLEGRNELMKTENTGIQMTTGLVKGVNDTGATKAVGGVMNKVADLANGGLGEMAYDAKEAIGNKASEIATELRPMMNSISSAVNGLTSFFKKKDTGSGGKQPITIKNTLPDGKITERTTK